MVVNLSKETIETVHSALKSVKTDLKRQRENFVSDNKIEIVNYQLNCVEDALAIFDELIDFI